MKKVYLAGGFARKGKVDWREALYNTFGNVFWGNKVYFYDPFLKERDVRYKEVMLPDKNYWVWDKYAIKDSDIFFCYLQKTNPGIGLYLELGYAHALDKTIILVIEYGNGEEAIADRYRNECMSFADSTFYSLDSGIKFLESLL
jgi:nucleoside 2-deoxyribosyltransferase